VQKLECHKLINLNMLGHEPSYSSNRSYTYWSDLMNSSISGADAVTHLKIVSTALAAAIVVVWVGIAAHATPTSDASSARISATTAPVFAAVAERWPL
jgi:hypothetical protein